MSKQEKAIEIVKANEGKTRKDIIAIIVADLGMTDAGASTYYYNAQKAIKGAEGDGGTSGAKTTKVDPIKEAAKAAATKKAPKVEAAASKETIEAAPGGGTGTEKVRESELTGSDAWMKRNAALRGEIQTMLDQIDINEIPAFLRK